MPEAPRRTRARTLTKSDFVERIRQLTGLPRVESADMLEAVLETMKQALESGETVKASGFGNFVVRAKAARKGRNPKTNKAMTLPRRKVLVFKPSQVLRAALKGEG